MTLLKEKLKQLIFIALLIGIFPTINNAQFKVPVTVPDTTGFYRIWLQPDVNELLDIENINLRLFDINFQETRYYIESDDEQYFSKTFVDYPIISTELMEDSFTNIILHNPSNSRIDNLSLQIRNAGVGKKYRLSGSFNHKVWYIIQDGILSASTSKGELYELKLIDFPLSNYTFLRFRIDDKGSLPINIERAGYYQYSTKSGNYSTINLKEELIETDKETNQTNITLVFDTLQEINKIKLDISKPLYFSRKLSVKKPERNKKGKLMWKTIYSGTISSEESPVISLPKDKYLELKIVVENNDNPALTFQQIKCSQINRYAIAYLEAGKKYYFDIRPREKAPVYDLKKFASLVPRQSPIVMTDKIEVLTPKELEAHLPLVLKVLQDKRFIWGALIAVFGLLAAMVYRMLKQSEK